MEVLALQEGGGMKTTSRPCCIFPFACPFDPTGTLPRLINVMAGLCGYAYLREYPLSLSHSASSKWCYPTPRNFRDVYANRVNISRATYFYQLRGISPALVRIFDQWEWPRT
jgi:hypothetical protein